MSVLLGYYYRYERSLLLISFPLAISGKLSVTVDKIVKPLVDVGGKYEGKIKVIFRNQVQPWHGSSTFTHEAGLAVSALELISK